MTNRVSRAGIETAARVLDVEPAAIRAVLAVESRGSGYDGKGRLLILYEPHVLWRNLSGNDRLRAQHQGLAYPKWGAKPYPRDSYPAFNRAVDMFGEPAYRSASYGAPQLLGENFKQCGYASAEQMFRRMSAGGEDEHLAAMARFIRANPAMHKALRSHDWREFARRYNGPGYAKNRYDTKLAAAFASYRGNPWRGLSVAKPAAGATMPEQTRAATQKAVATGGAAAATGAAGTASTVSVVTPEARAGVPDWAIYAGLGVGLAVILAVVIFIARRNRAAERAPIIEGV